MCCAGKSMQPSHTKLVMRQYMHNIIDNNNSNNKVVTGVPAPILAYCECNWEMRSYLHDAIGVIDHVRCREEHTAAPHKTCVLADREGNEQWQVVYQGCVAQYPCSRVGDVIGVPCIVYMS